jgi:hypothetical protein
MRELPWQSRYPQTLIDVAVSRDELRSISTILIKEVGQSRARPVREEDVQRILGFLLAPRECERTCQICMRQNDWCARFNGPREP